MAAAAGLLAARPRTVTDTRTRLATMGFPSGLVDQAIERLVTLGYLDDVRYATAWIESRDRSRPRGAAVLRQELRRKGVEPSVIEQALGERAVEGAGVVGPAHVAAPPGASRPDVTRAADTAAARRLLERRSAALRREPDPRKRRQKAYGLLARNGFDPGVCAEVARSIGDRDEDPPEDA